MSDHKSEATLQHALDAAKQAGADAADAVLISSTDLSVSQRLGKPEEMERAESKAIGLRTFVGNKSAVISATDLSAEAMHKAAERAVAMARASLEDANMALATREQWATAIPNLDLCDPSEPDIAWMREQCAITEEVARTPKGIANSEGAEMGYAYHAMSLVTSEGFTGNYESSSYVLSISVLAGEGDKMERDYAYGVARHREDLRSAEDIGEEAAERTLKRLNPQKVSTQNVPVVFDPRVARSLLSNFASAISGSSVARGTSFLKDKMGEKLFANSIAIIDDPTRVRGLGSKPFDGEGIACEPLNLVENGTLNHWLLDIRTANQLGLKTNGRASRGLGSHPSPSSTNLYIEAGEVSPEALIKEIENGFYVTDAFGMGVNLVTGDYSQGANGFWIENGAISYAVSELTIASHLLEMFTQITPANDLRFEYGTNAPTLRVDRMMVAGV